MKSLLIPQLIWKDYRLIRPLVLFIFGLAIVMNLSQPGNSENKLERYTAAIELWVLIPHLFALLAPLILVGTEREAGTTRWLRQFPVSWQRIAASERCTAAIGLLSVWIFSTVNVVTMCLIAGLPSPGEFTNYSFIQAGISLLHMSFSSLAWLMTSFVIVQLIRSAVIASIPIVLFGFFLTLSVHYTAAEAIIMQKVIGLGEPIYMIGTMAAFVVLGSLSLVIAGRQMNQNDDQSSISQILRLKLSRPHTRQTNRPNRPSAWRALLWQQFRQIQTPAAIWVGITLFIAGMTWWSQLSSTEMFFFTESTVALTTILGGLSIGVLAFYHDNCKGGKTFLADRGISPKTVWLTRLLPAYIASLPIQFILILTISIPNLFASKEPAFNEELIKAISFSTIIFVSGLIVSQGIERPIYAFLLAPCLCCFVLAMLLVWAPETKTGHIITAFILLFGSLQLTRRWMDGQVNLRFAASLIGYITLATLPWPVVFFLTR